MEELIGPIKNDSERLESIRHFFSTEEWNDLVPYQRMVYGRLWENYEVMQRLGLTESKPDFVIKWERRKAASGLPKSSTSSANKSSSLFATASTSTTLQNETKSVSGIKKSRKRHPKVVDPDWTPQLETSLRNSSGLSKTLNTTPLPPPTTAFKVPRIKNSESFRGSLSKYSSTSGRKKNNRPVWPTSRKVQREKILLSDNQSDVFKYFKSIGVLEPGQEGIAEIKIERPRSVIKQKSFSEARSVPVNIKNMYHGNTKCCKVNEVETAVNKEYDPSKMADSVVKMKSVGKSSNKSAKNKNNKHSDILDGVSLPTLNRCDGKPNSLFNTETNFKKERSDMDIRIELSANINEKGNFRDALENQNHKNNSMEDKIVDNEGIKSPIECRKTKSSQLEKSEEYLKPEFRKLLDIELKTAGKSGPEHRYPKRNIQRRKFIRHLGPDDFQKEEGIYCVSCKRKYYTMCLRHPLTLIKNVNLPRDGSVPDRIHKSAPFPLKVTESKLPGAGEGVVTTHELPAGLVFGPYEGAIVPHVTEENETGYGWEVEEDEECGRTVVDASDPSLSNWLSKVNCPNTEEEDNLAEQFMFGNVFYITKKHIPSGSELCVYYGDSYAEELGIDKKSANWNIAGTTKSPDTFEQDVMFNSENSFIDISEASSKNSGYKKLVEENTSTCQANFPSTNCGSQKIEVVKDKSCSEIANLTTKQRSLNQFQDDKIKLCFRTKGTLNSDKEAHGADVHSKEIGLVCEYCKQWRCPNHDLGLLQKHYKTCTEYYKSKQHLSQVDALRNSQPHNMTKQTIDKTYQCPQCDHRTALKCYLNRHIMAKHTGDKPHRCPHCDYQTAYSGDLKKHIMAKHTGEKPYGCPHCDYRTAWGEHIKSHIRGKHTGDKPHGCPHCDYRATRSDMIKPHIMSKHTGEKPHRCPHCDYRASQSGSLKAHITAKHTGDNPHGCPHCDYQTGYSSSLKRHIRAKHT